MCASRHASTKTWSNAACHALPQQLIQLHVQQLISLLPGLAFHNLHEHLSDLSDLLQRAYRSVFGCQRSMQGQPAATT